MPQLSDLIEKKKFVKKSYRPWDLSGTGTVDGKEAVVGNKDNDAHSTSAHQTQIATVAEEHPPLEKVSSLEAQISAISKLLNKTTGNKTGNKQVTEEVTTRQQPGNNQVTTGNRRGNNQVTTRQQPGNITGNITGNTEEHTNLINNIKKLNGLQRDIFLYIVNLCSARGELDTGNLLSSDLANAANCSIGSAKTSLIRLIEKDLILRLPGKACRGGHMVLGITHEAQTAAIQAERALFNPFKMYVTGNRTGNDTGNKGTYSSSNNKNNTTTSLPEDWKNINFNSLQSIGFSETQIRQLFDSNMTSPAIIQDAINRFAYSLENSDKVKAYADPLNVLMGVLRKGQKWNEPNYISPKELALRQIVEEKRKQKETYDVLIKELVELEFPNWRRKLTETELTTILPEEIRKTNLAAAVNATLRTYFIEKILVPRLEIDDIKLD